MSVIGGKTELGILQAHLIVGPFVTPPECSSKNLNE
jgi:hypothetical protein